jgi:hypothetical protein
LVPLSPSPIRTNPSDPWDIRFLGAAFDLTAQLDAGSAGFSAQAATLDADALRLLVPGFPAGLTSGALTARLPGEQLVGAAIAASDRAAAGGVGQRLASVLSFRDDGATWGLVVLDQAGADQDQVLALMREAIGRWAAQAGGLTAAPFLAPRPGASSTGTPPTAPASSSPVQPPGVTPRPSPPTTVVGPLPVPVPPTVPPAVPPTVPPVVPDPLPIPPTGTPADDVINAIGGLAHLPGLPVTPPSLP